MIYKKTFLAWFGAILVVAAIVGFKPIRGIVVEIADNPPPSANATYWNWCVRAVDAEILWPCTRYNDCYSIIASDPSITPKSVSIALDSRSPNLANSMNYLLTQMIAGQCLLKFSGNGLLL